MTAAFPMAEAIGWLATAVFVSSYFFGEARAVRRVQMLGAGLWMAYGVATAAVPVVVANVLVLGAAAFAPVPKGRRRSGALHRSAADSPGSGALHHSAADSPGSGALHRSAADSLGSAV